MYNEEQKKAFIASYTKSNKTTALIVQIFTWFEPYESTWGADLSQQTSEVLQPVVNKISGLRSKSTELVLIILKEYVRWCIRNGLEVDRGIFDVRIHSIEKIKKQMVASPLHLQFKLNEIFRLTEEETIDIVYRVFLWMAFAGLEDSDAIRVTSDDVDLQNLRINFEGHSYEIYKESREDFEKACNLTDFFYEHPCYTVRRERAEGNLIMRGFRSSSLNLQTLRPMVTRKINDGKGKPGDTQTRQEGKKQKKDVISYKRIYLSGIFYRAYECERAGLSLNFSVVVANEMQRKNKEYTLSKTRTLNTIANKIEREYKTDYEKWKCAFV